MKVALVHDWIIGMGGAENVLYELHKMFPNAPIYTSVYDEAADGKFINADIRTSRLQNIPLAKTKHRFFPLARRRVFENLDLSEYDLVISSSGAEAKGIRTQSKTKHICYCHAPTHYYWSRYEDYLQNRTFGLLDPFTKAYLRATIQTSRRWDYLAAQGPDVMVANSSHIAREIEKYYDRHAEIIHPPVNVEHFSLSTGKRNGFLIVGRQVHYKRIDLAISAANSLKAPLIVVGNGPLNKFLRSIAGPTVRFITKATNDDVAELMGQAEAFIFPGLDDFGIVPVEAMATGTPVIAYKAGGALDYVNPQTGVFFKEQKTASLVDAMQKFRTKSFKPQTVHKMSNDFSNAVFRNRFKELIHKTMS